VTVTITDQKLLEKLLAGGSTVDLTGPNGEKFGTLTIERKGVPPVGFQVPFTEEEIAERRKDRTGGRPLADILRDLKGKYGE
jgi:hypothetical protein